MYPGKAEYKASGETVDFVIFDGLGASLLSRTKLPKDVMISSLWSEAGTYYAVDTKRHFFTPVSTGDVIIYHDRYNEVISKSSFYRLYNQIDTAKVNKIIQSTMRTGYITVQDDYGITKRRPYEDRDINDLAKEVSEWRKSKKFQTPSKFKDHSSILIKLMLVVSELSEASEAVRNNDEMNFREELADTIIRILDLTGTMGIDISEEIRKKMLKNADRPEKHGKSI